MGGGAAGSRVYMLLCTSCVPEQLVERPYGQKLEAVKMQEFAACVHKRRFGNVTEVREPSLLAVVG
jgi:hypothetical protein